jgi:hypothetical protein
VYVGVVEGVNEVPVRPFKRYYEEPADREPKRNDRRDQRPIIANNPFHDGNLSSKSKELST